MKRKQPGRIFNIPDQNYNLKGPGSNQEPAPTVLYHYWVSYWVNDNNPPAPGFMAGHIQVFYNAPIQSADDLELITRYVCQRRGYRLITIVSWNLLKTEYKDLPLTKELIRSGPPLDWPPVPNPEGGTGTGKGPGL